MDNIDYDFVCHSCGELINSTVPYPIRCPECLEWGNPEYLEQTDDISLPENDNNDGE